MSKNPWTDPDPQPGDFDADLAQIDPRFVEAHAGNPEAKLRLLISVEGEDVVRLSGSPGAREDPGDVVAELVRDADRSACVRNVASQRTERTRFQATAQAS